MAHPDGPPDPSTPSAPTAPPGAGDGWAVPDAPAAPGPVSPAASGVPTALDEQLSSTSLVSSAALAGSHLYNEVGVRLPVPMRPMSVADVLDGSFAIMKSRPRTIFAIVFAIVGPVLLLQALVGGTFYSYGSALTMPSSMLTTNPSGAIMALQVVGSVVAFAAMNFALYLVGAGLARVLSAWYAGGDITAGDALRAVRSRFVPLLGLWAIQAPITLVCAATLYCMAGVVLLPVVVGLLSFTAPIVMMEKVGPIDAMRRSWRLAVKRLVPVVGITLLVFIVQSLATIVFQYLTMGLFFGAASPGGWGIAARVAGVVLSSLITLLTVPYVTGASVLLYLDQRIRSEGLDLELETARAFG